MKLRSTLMQCLWLGASLLCAGGLLVGGRALMLYEGTPLSVEIPPSVVMQVVEADPVVRGQTASSSYKPAVLSNGVRTAVPPHVAVGTRIVVMTEDGSYVERAKD